MLIRPGIRRFGRPGLLGTMARTAVVAGTATAVVGGMHRHQQNRAIESAEADAYQQQQQLAAVPPPAPATVASPAGPDDPVAQLERLAALKQQGVLSDAEFVAAKSKILGL